MKDRARAFAIEAHGEQKYGVHPYVTHLDAVAGIVSRYGEQAEIIAYLHDVVEDTDVEIDEIKAVFGKQVSEAVSVLTDEPGANRKERKTKTYAKMSRVSGQAEIALIVKAADRLANFRNCIEEENEKLLAMYKDEFEMFRNAAYRPGICEELWDELDALQEA